jgi:hypothetical protein
MDLLNSIVLLLLLLYFAVPAVSPERQWQAAA